MAYTQQPITHQYTMFNGEMVDSELVYYYQMYEDTLLKLTEAERARDEYVKLCNKLEKENKELIKKLPITDKELKEKLDKKDEELETISKGYHLVDQHYSEICDIYRRTIEHFLGKDWYVVDPLDHITCCEYALREMKALYPSYDSQPHSTSEWLHAKLGIVGDTLNKIIEKLSSIFKDFHIEFE